MIHRLIRLLTLWHYRVEARRALAMVDSRCLRDAGIDPGAAAYAIAQPFRRPLLPLRDALPRAAAAAVANDCGPLVASRPARRIASSGR